MTQEQLAYVIDRDPRTVMYNENDGQHPSLNTFYQIITMFDISVSKSPSRLPRMPSIKSALSQSVIQSVRIPISRRP